MVNAVKNVLIGAIILTAAVQAVSAPAISAFKDTEGDRNEIAIYRVTQSRVMQGYPDGSFRPGKSVTEGEFARTLDRLLVARPTMGDPDFEARQPELSVARVRAVVAIVRGTGDKLAMDSLPDTGKILSAFGDGKSIPGWAAKHVAYALDHGYIEADKKFRPNDPLTRSELAGILASCLPPTASPAHAVAGITASVAAGIPAVSQPKPPGKVTGLVVDCRGLGLLRCMSPMVVSENGGRVYPDPKHLPSIDFVEEVGMASYVTDVAAAKRAGDNPLQVKAVRVEGAARQTAVVSNADRDAILSAEKDGRFLQKYQVTFLIDGK